MGYMAQVEYHTQLVKDLADLIIKQGDGNDPLSKRLQLIINKSKMEILTELEKIIKECKSKDLKVDNATFQTLKHVYRKLI
jgi:hypothetical protein